MINEKMLEARIARLEKLLTEKTMGRNGEQSNAYKIWNFLMSNGPKTAEEIKAIFPPEKRATIAANLAGFPKKGVIIKQGGRFMANPDYEWDDVGKIAGRSLAKIKADLDREEIIPAETQLISDFSIDEITTIVNEEFEKSSAGSVASLILDNQTLTSFECTIEFDEYDYLLKLYGEVNDGTLSISVPCTVYDDSEDEIGEVEWKGKSEFAASCNKVRTLKMIMGMCGAAVVKMMEQFDGLE